jgi:hypothetical protein
MFPYWSQTTVNFFALTEIAILLTCLLQLAHRSHIIKRSS